MTYHSLSPNLVLAYHGCEKAVGLDILAGKKSFKNSDNDYDWLGPGIYFWEANPNRALSFAKEQKARGRIKTPFVVGAVLSLGNCIDTLSEYSTQAIKVAYDDLVNQVNAQGGTLPKNTGKGTVFRRLDCAVIKRLHEMSEQAGLPPADSVRAAYFEGDPLYDTSGFYSKSHTQICIINPGCIKGVFRVNG